MGTYSFSEAYSLLSILGKFLAESPPSESAFSSSLLCLVYTAVSLGLMQKVIRETTKGSCRKENPSIIVYLLLALSRGTVPEPH